jgi:hypothetical protein
MASTPEAERRAQLIACTEAVAKLAKRRNIEPVHVRFRQRRPGDPSGLGNNREALTLRTPTRFISIRAANNRGAKLHREHVVPCRVLVDRMIMNPMECRALSNPAFVISCHFFTFGKRYRVASNSVFPDDGGPTSSPQGGPPFKCPARYIARTISTT